MHTHSAGEVGLQWALPEDVDRKPFPSFPAAARLAVVGDPAEPGLVFYIGGGQRFHGDKLDGFPPGVVIVLPGGTPHFQWAKSGESVTQMSAISPRGLEYLERDDGPRNR